MTRSSEGSQLVCEESGFDPSLSGPAHHEALRARLLPLPGPRDSIVQGRCTRLVSGTVLCVDHVTITYRSLSWSSVSKLLNSG